MKILDFLFYYLARWFQVIDRRKTKTVSYPDQVSYTLAICCLFWLLLIDGVIEYFLFKTFDSKISKFVFIALGILVYFLFRHIYINNGRYDKILEMSDPKFNVTDKTGRIIAVLVFVFSFLILFLSAILLHIIDGSL